MKEGRKDIKRRKMRRELKEGKIWKEKKVRK